MNQPQLADRILDANPATHRRVLRVAMTQAIPRAALDTGEQAALVESFERRSAPPDELRKRPLRRQQAAEECYLSLLDELPAGGALPPEMSLNFQLARAVDVLLGVFKCADAIGVCEVVYEALAAQDEPSHLASPLDRALRSAAN